MRAVIWKTPYATSFWVADQDDPTVEPVKVDFDLDPDWKGKIDEAHMARELVTALRKDKDSSFRRVVGNH